MADWQLELLEEDARRSAAARQRDAATRAAAMQLQQIDQSPDKAAAIGTIARETGLPTTQIEGHVQELRQSLTAQGVDWSRVPQPVLSMASDPVTATVVRDDIEALSVPARLIAYANHGYRQAQALSDRATLGLIRRQRELTSAERRQLVSVEATLAEQIDEDSFGSFFGVNVPSTIANVATQFVSTIPDVIERATQFGAAGAGAGAVLGSLAGGVGAAPGAAAGGLLGLGYGARAGMWEHSTKLEAGNAYMDLLDEGHDEPSAWLAANVYGAAAGALDAIGIARAVAPAERVVRQRLLKEATRDLFEQRTRRWALGEAGKELAAISGTEAVTEALQASLQQATYAYMRSRDPDKFDQATAREIIETIALEGFAGAIGGAALGSAGATMQYANDMRAVRQAQANAEFMKALGASVEGTRLRERMPDELASFVNQAAGEGLETIGIDAAGFVQYWQSQGQDARTAAEQLGVADQLDQALAAGGDLVVSLGTAVSKLAGSAHYAGLLPDMRIGSGLTIRETEQALAQADTSREVWEKEVAAAIDDDVLRDEIVGHFETQLAKESSLPTRVRATEARLAALGIVNMARAAGVEPREYWGQWQVAVQRALAPQSGDQAQSFGRVVADLDDPSVLSQDAPVEAQSLTGGTPQDLQAFAEDVAQRRGLSRLELRETRPGLIEIEMIAAKQAGQGAGTAAMRDLVAYADRTGKRLVLQLADAGTQPVEGGAVTTSSERLRRFYRRFGFVSNRGRRKDYSLSLYAGMYRDPQGALFQQALVEAQTIADSKQWRNNRDFKLALDAQARASAETAKVNLDHDSPALRDWIIRQALHDLQIAMESNAGAIGWYDRAVREMWGVLALMHEELGDPQGEGRFAMRVALAVSSNGLEVVENLPLAVAMYERWKRDGALPEDMGRGTSRQAMNRSLALVNRLTKEWGWRTVERFFDSEFTVGELTRAGYPISGENVDQVVYGAAVLGPKIGNGFYANLGGRFDSLTMDRWFMRTIGRWRGSLVTTDAKRIGAARDAFAAAIREARADRGAWKALRAVLGQDLKLNDLDGSAEQLSKFATIAARREALGAVKHGDRLRKTANNLATAIDGQNETPKNGADRARIRDMMRQTLVLASDMAPGLKMADLQALYWYMEQELYRRAKTKPGEAVPALSTDEEPNYANSAAAVARGRGIANEAIADARQRAIVGGTARDPRAPGRPRRRAPGSTGLVGIGGLDGNLRREFLDRLTRFTSGLAQENVEPYSVSEPSEPRMSPAKRASRRQAKRAVAELEAAGAYSILGNAISKQFKEREYVPLLGQRVVSTADLAVLVQAYRDPRFETFRMYFTDEHGVVVHQTATTSRMPGAAPVGPDVGIDEWIAQMGDAAAAVGATGFYLSHNHPSGNIHPSFADHQVTQALRDQLLAVGGLEFRGHVITDTFKYSVIREAHTPHAEEQLPPTYRPDYRAPAPAAEAVVQHSALGASANNPKEIAELALLLGATSAPLMIGRSGTTGAVRGIAEIDLERMFSPQRMQSVVEEFARATGSVDVAIVGFESKHKQLVLDVGQAGWLIDALMLNGGELLSLRASGDFKPPPFPKRPEPDIDIRTVQEDPAPYEPGAAPPRAEQEQDAGRDLYQSDPLWYSRLHYAVDASKRGKGTPSEWRAELASMAKRGLIAEAEMRAVGIDDFFGLFDDTESIPRERLAKWLSTNGVMLSEVHYGDIDVRPAAKADATQLRSMFTFAEQLVVDMSVDISARHVANGIGLKETVDRFMAEVPGLVDRLMAENPGLVDQAGPNRGGGALVFDDPSIRDLVTSAIEVRVAQLRGGGSPQYQRYFMPGLTDYVELVLRLEDSRFEFKSNHWNETNVVVHIRGGDLGDGSFLLDEIQSDWGQSARGAAGPANARFDAAVAELEEAQRAAESARSRAERVRPSNISAEQLEQFSRIEVRAPANGVNVIAAIANDGTVVRLANGEFAYWPSVMSFAEGALVGAEKASGFSFADAVALSELEAAKTRLSDAQLAADKARSERPHELVERTDAWVRLALRRTLRYAVDKGYQRIVITPGIDQSLRYGKDTSSDRLRGMSEFYSGIVEKQLARVIKEFGGQITHGHPLPLYFEGKQVHGVFRDLEEMWLAPLDKDNEPTFDSALLSFGSRTEGREAQQMILERIERGASAVEITDAMRAGFARPQPLFQQPGAPRGAYGFVGYRQAIIKMFEGHDESTFLHEAAGHLFLEMLRDLHGTSEAMGEQFQRDIAALEQYLGTSMADIGREQHEVFARSMEAYLREGKAPVESLRDLFARAAQWLQHLYKTDKALRVELTPEVRAVFDRIFATREQIEAQAQAMHVRPLFDVARDAGMTEAEFRAYRAAALKALDVARAGLLAEYEAKEAALRSKAAKERREALRPAVEADVARRSEVRLSTYLRTGKLPGDEVPAPGWKTRKIDREELQDTLDGYMRTGVERPGGQYTMEDFAGVVQAKGGHSLEELQAMFGMRDLDEVLAAAQYTPTFKEAVEAELDARIEDELGDTLSPEFARRAAEAKLAESSEAVLEVELRALRRLEAVQRAGARKVQEEGAPTARITEQARTDANADAVAAARTRGIEGAQSEVLAAAAADAEARAAVGQRRAQASARRQVEAVNREAIPVRDDLARLRARARQMVRELPIERALRRGVFSQAAARAARQAERAIAERRYDAAALAKRQQILNLELLRAANEIAESVRKDLKFANSLRKPSVRQKIDADYRDLIDDVMAQYAFFRVSGRTLANWESRRAWYDAQVAKGEIPRIDPKLVDDTKRTPYHKLTAEQFDAVIDNLQLLAHQGRTKSDLRIAGRKRQLEEIAVGVANAVLQNAGDFEHTIGGDSFVERSRRRKSYLSSIFFRPFAIVRALDGGKEGAVFEALKRPIDDAVNDALTPRQAIEAQRLDALYAKHYTNAQLRRMDRKVYSQRRLGKMSRAEVLALALNWGNLDNRQAVLGGGLMQERGVTEADVLEAINMLEANDMAFVRDVWEHLETFWPEIYALHRERTGERLRKVEAAAYPTRHGMMPGGYYSLKYMDRPAVHRVRGVAAARNAATSVTVSAEVTNAAFQALAGGRFSKAQTARGHTIERVGSGGRDVRLDLNVMHAHIDQVVRDLTLGEAVTGVYKVMHHPLVQAAFIDSGLIETHRALDLWIKDVAAGELMFNNDAERFLRHVRTGFTLSRLGFNFGSAAIQITGLSQTLAVIGTKDTLLGLRRVMQNLFSLDEITQATPFMRERLGTWNKDMNDSIALTRGSGWRRSFTVAAYWMISRVQLIVDAITWAAAYEQGIRMHPLDDAEARSYADRTTARAQSTGLFNERSALERGTLSENVRQSEFVRLWTVLASYMINKASIARDVTARTQFTNPVQALMWAMDMAMLFVIEGILVAVIRGQVPDDEDDDESWPMFIGRTGAEQVLGSFPFLREIPSLMKGFDGGGAAGSFLGQLADAAKQTVEAFDDPGEQLDIGLFKSLNNLGGTVFHYPAAAVNRFASALQRDFEGEDVPLIEYFMARGNP